MSWGWGGSNRNRKHCFLLMRILCPQPRRPTPGCLPGLPSFIKKAKAGLNLLGTSHLQRYSQTWLFGEDSPFSPRKQGSDFIPRLTTEDPKWRPNDSLESGQVLSGRVQCGAGQAALCFCLPHFCPSILPTGPGVGGVGGEGQSGVDAHVGRQSFIPEALHSDPCFMCVFCAHVPRQSVPFFKAMVLYLSNIVTL